MKCSFLSKLSSFFFQNTTFKQTVLKNSFWLLFSEFFAKIFTFLLGIWISQKFGDSWLGEFNWIISFCAFFVAIVDFWLGNLIFREISKHPEKSEKYFMNGSIIKLWLTLLVTVLVRIGGKFHASIHESETLLFLFLFHSILVNFAEFLRVFFRPVEKMEKEAFLKILSWFSLVGFTIFFLSISQSLFAIFLGYLTSSIVTVIFSFFYVKKHFQFKKFERDLPFIKETLKLSIPFFLGSISAYFYGDMNIVLLEHFTDKTTVAYFSTPYKLITYVYLLFNVVAISFFKKFVEVRNDKVQFLSRVKKAWLLHLGISIPFVLFFFFGGKWILSFYGTNGEFISSYSYLLILLRILPIKALSYLFWNLITALSKEYTRLYIQIFIALLALGLNFLFVPQYGIRASCFILLLSEILLLGFYGFFARKYMKKLPVR